MIKFKCHGCNSVMNVKDEAAGRKGKCPQCGNVVLVPGPSHQPHEGVDGQRQTMDDREVVQFAAQTVAGCAQAAGKAAKASYSGWQKFRSNFLTITPPAMPQPALCRCLACHAAIYAYQPRCGQCGERTASTDLSVWFVPENEEIVDPVAAAIKLLRQVRTLRLLFIGAFLLFALLAFMASGFWLGLGWSFMSSLVLMVIYCVSVFIAARKMGRLKERSKKGDAQQLRLAEDFCKERVFPFLDRNGVDLFGWRQVSADELQLLRETMQARGLSIATERLDGFLQICGLRRDYGHFAARIRHFEVDTVSATEAYSQLYPDAMDTKLLPYLQQFLAETGMPCEASALLGEIGAFRRQHQLRGFEKDLDLRKSGGSVNIAIEAVDLLEPYNFEELLAMIFESQGYRAEKTGRAGDQGADVVLEKAGERTVVQAKLYSQPVSNSAVQEAVAAKRHYGCQYAMVVTNNTFTPGGRELATSNAVTLIDREKLAVMLDTFNRAPKDYARLVRIMIPRVLNAVQETRAQ